MYILYIYFIYIYIYIYIYMYIYSEDKISAILRYNVRYHFKISL